MDRIASNLAPLKPAKRREPKRVELELLRLRSANGRATL